MLSAEAICGPVHKLFPPTVAAFRPFARSTAEARVFSADGDGDGYSCRLINRLAWQLSHRCFISPKPSRITSSITFSENEALAIRSLHKRAQHEERIT